MNELERLNLGLYWMFLTIVSQCVLTPYSIQQGD